MDTNIQKLRKMKNIFCTTTHTEIEKQSNKD